MSYARPGGDRATGRVTSSPMKSAPICRARRRVRCIGARPGTAPDEFLLFTGAPSRCNGRFPVVYAGYGIVAPERGSDDTLRDADLRGKATTVFFGAPWPLDPDGLHEWDRGLGKSLQAGLRGASVLMYVSPEFDSPREKPASVEVDLFRQFEPMPVSFLTEAKGKRVPPLTDAQLVLRPAAFDRVLAEACGGTYEELSRKLASGKTGEPSGPSTQSWKSSSSRRSSLGRLRTSWQCSQARIPS